MWLCVFMSYIIISGDEIEPADGDDKEVYRILFDITFFFFVVIILLAIIQGKNNNIEALKISVAYFTKMSM